VYCAMPNRAWPHYRVITGGEVFGRKRPGLCQRTALRLDRRRLERLQLEQWHVESVG
jgi:hypothetical protein